MWSNFADVTKKLKDIAIELAQPHYDDDDYDNEKQVVLGEAAESARQQHNVTRTSRDHDTAPVDYPATLRLQTNKAGNIAPPTRKTTAPPDVGSTQPLCQPQRSSMCLSSVDGGTACPGGEESQKAPGLSLKEDDLESVGATSPSAGALKVHCHESSMSELLLQLQKVSEEKQQLKREVAAYKEEMAVVIAKNTECYEQKIALLQTELASQKKQKKELEEKLAFYVQESVSLQNEVKRLKEREQTLDCEAQKAKEAEDEVKKLLALREEQYVEALQRISSLENTRTNSQEQEQKEKDCLSSSAFASFSDAFMDGDNLLATTTDERKMKELYERINTVEKRNSTIMREKENLTSLLDEIFFLLQAAFDEKEEILNVSCAHAELLFRLIQQLDNEWCKVRQAREGAKEPSLVDVEHHEHEKKMKTSLVSMGAEHEETKKVSMHFLESAHVVTPGAQSDIVRRANEVSFQHVAPGLTNDNNLEEAAVFTEQHETQSCDIVERLTRELRDAEHQLSEFQEQQLSLQMEIQQLKSCLADSQSEVKGLCEKLTLAEGRAAELESTLANAQRTVEEHDTSLFKALATRKRELEVKCMKSEEIIRQLEHIVSDCIVRANIEITQSRDADAGASFSDKLTVLASEFNRLFDAAKNAERREKEWGLTYEQARNVNATLTQQVGEAWKTIGRLREELSLRDQSLAKLKQQVQTESQRHHETQQQLASVMNELQALKEEKNVWEAPAVGFGAAETCEELLTTMSVDLDTLRRALQDREEELAQAQRGMETLQEVLNTFTQNKARDVKERTAELQVEIDQLREQLSLVERQRQRHQDQIEALNSNHIQEIAAKNLEIKSLHRKHAELRTALEETASQLNGSMLIDKRVISHITVNFIHAFVAQRPEANEMLKVLSGLLNWDEATQEKAGLLPGPTNPKIAQQRRQGGLIDGIVSTVWGGSGRKMLSKASKSRVSPSIAELWVEFLMRESETVLAEEKDLPPATTLTSATETIATVEEEDANDRKFSGVEQ